MDDWIGNYFFLSINGSSLTRQKTFLTVLAPLVLVPPNSAALMQGVPRERKPSVRTFLGNDAHRENTGVTLTLQNPFA